MLEGLRDSLHRLIRRKIRHASLVDENRGGISSNYPPETLFAAEQSPSCHLHHACEASARLFRVSSIAKGVTLVDPVGRNIDEAVESLNAGQ
jgi:hypothetical protein